MAKIRKESKRQNIAVSLPIDLIEQANEAKIPEKYPGKRGGTGFSGFLKHWLEKELGLSKK
jgi:hypothetical protein